MQSKKGYFYYQLKKGGVQKYRICVGLMLLCLTP